MSEMDLSYQTDCSVFTGARTTIQYKHILWVCTLTDIHAHAYVPINIPYTHCAKGLSLWHSAGQMRRSIKSWSWRKSAHHRSNIHDFHWTAIIYKLHVNSYQRKDTVQIHVQTYIYVYLYICANMRYRVQQCFCFILVCIDFLVLNKPHQPLCRV